MSATSDRWPIFTPTSQAKPLDQILSRIGHGTVHTILNASERATLLAALAAAGQPAPTRTAPVFVFRTDATPGLEVEYTTDGTTWTPVGTGRVATVAALPTTVPDGTQCWVTAGNGYYVRSSGAWRRVLVDGDDDTGPLTSGLDIAFGTGWTIGAYTLRRVRGHVTGMVNASYGSAITPATSGNVSPDLPVLTLPDGWRPSYTADVLGRVQTVSQTGSTLSAAGVLTLIAISNAGATVAAGTNQYFTLSHSVG